MSFELELDVPGLTEEQAEAVHNAVKSRGGWPVHVHRKGLFRKRVVGLWSPSDLGPDERLLTDNAEWDAPAWDMNPKLLPLLAETVKVLGEQLPQGFSFRATWVSSPVRRKHELSAEELAALVLASQLNEHTLYRVPGDSPRGNADVHFQ